jgi:hypothetical protein
MIVHSVMILVRLTLHSLNGQSFFKKTGLGQTRKDLYLWTDICL